MVLFCDSRLAVTYLKLRTGAGNTSCLAMSRISPRLGISTTMSSAKLRNSCHRSVRFRNWNLFSLLWFVHCLCEFRSLIAILVYANFPDFFLV